MGNSQMNDDGIEVLAEQKTLKVLPDIKIILELISKGVSLRNTLNTLVEYIDKQQRNDLFHPFAG